MVKYNVILFFFVSMVLSSITFLMCSATESGDESSKLYIVYMGSLPNEASYSATSHHLNILEEVIGDIGVEDLLVQSYKRSFNGFSAILNDQQREKLLRMKDVVSVFPSQNFHIQTTRSWDFLGFPQSIKRDQIIESDLIIGVIDSGIWPESESFNDKGLGPIPKKWKGVCKGGANFTCNKKIIGARFYGNAKDARDEAGHGTHTSSTAGGREVQGVSFYDLAKGTARGGVPSSRIAVYKLCGPDGSCTGSNMLAAFDDAIADGVDIISISIGSDTAVEFLKDPIAIASFHAMEKGILTSHSAGNSGPSPSSTSSVAPWLFSVAATTIDRQFIDKLVLGNGKTLIGRSVNTFTSNGTKNSIAKVSCYDGFIETEVKGKIVVCESLGYEDSAFENGASGIVSNVELNDISYVSQMPSVNLNSKDYVLVQSYINSTKSPVAEILKSEIFHDTTSPRIASFSSRGPNTLVLDIMKPDISAPGVDILAAFSPLASPSENFDDTRKVNYSIVSGTSMACPHITGIAAYVKSFHPDWSPAAIKSAIMTTAKPVNGTYIDLAGEFSYGSGNANPRLAVDPGLIYNITKDDYVQMLCNYGYDNGKIKQITRDNSSCRGASNLSLVKDLNYPAIVISITSETPFNIKFPKTVTNVGSPNATYKAIITPIPNVKITVEPNLLSFKSFQETQSFVVTAVGRVGSHQHVLSSSLVWSDGTHKVKSPIIVQIKP
ncbi:subtilisin-like protease SBT4.3 [Vicia villosa]|uniref:subtilisin-like protease SBT4.3 n=1 Tax=Vicia villosa TaxID=3911 RepID=UPI00273C8511|nr:subtilisin-like protease SBT4.3 [Vicia villosa]